jgi:hypothetical protein
MGGFLKKTIKAYVYGPKLPVKPIKRIQNEKSTEIRLETGLSSNKKNFRLKTFLLIAQGF